MSDKKARMKFTVQFNRRDPSHLQVADILNHQQRYGKSQYIVDAVMHYIEFGLTESVMRPIRLDEKHIEAVVNRILRDRTDSGTGATPVAASAGQTESSPFFQPLFDEEIIFDDAVEALGEDGFNAIAGALDMFRRK